MSFREYLDQKGLHRSDYGSVEIRPDDVFARWRFMRNEIIQLHIYGEFYDYLVEPGSTTMHTMDEDGNKNGLSVFRFKEN